MKTWGTLFIVTILFMCSASTRIADAQTQGGDPSDRKLPHDQGPPSGPDAPQFEDAAMTDFHIAIKQSVRFTKLTMEDGLPNNFVAAFLRDSREFMWIGTSGGLARFDGFQITTYVHDPDNPESISGNEIHEILEDRRGKLWIACGPDGVSRFDPHNETFARYRVNRDDLPDVNDSAFSLVQDNEGTIWSGTVPGDLIRIEPDTGAMTVYPLQPEGQREPSPLWDILADRHGTLWAAATNALVKFDPQTEAITRYVPPGDRGEIRSLYEDHDGTIWLTAGDLYSFDPQKALAHLTEEFEYDEILSLIQAQEAP